MTTNDSQNYLLRLDSPPLEAIFRYLSNPVPLMRTCQTLRRAGQQHMSDEVINSHALGVLWSDMFSLEHVPVRARNNRSFLQIALRRDGPGFFYIADRFKHDIELIKIALASTKLLFPHRLSELVEYLLGSESGFEEIEAFVQNVPRVSEREWLKKGLLSLFEYGFTDDSHIALIAVMRQFDALSLLPKNTPLRGDRPFILRAVGTQGVALEFVSDEMKGDREIVLAAVHHMGRALEFADDQFKKEREVVRVAIESDPQALLFADDSLKDDLPLVFEAVEKSGQAVQFASDRLRNTKLVMLAAVQNYGGALSFASLDLQDDYDVVLASVQKNGMALKYASERLKKDFNTVFSAVQNDVRAFQFADKTLKRDPRIVFANHLHRRPELKKIL